MRIDVKSSGMWRLMMLLVVTSVTSVLVLAQESTEPEFRAYTRANGQPVQTKLAIIERDGDSFEMKREDNGEVVTVFLKQFSAQDQAWLRRIKTGRNPVVPTETDRPSSNSRPAMRNRPASAESTGRLSATLRSSRPSDSANWPCFRGPGRAGIAANANVPLTWNAETNIQWKYDLLGPGSSSPVVWGNRLFVTCYSGYGLSKESPGEMTELIRHLICVDAVTGRKLWQKDLPSTNPVMPYKRWLPYHGYASATPVVSRDAVFVSFGTSGLFAFSHEGQQLWHYETGKRKSGYGSAASPVLHEDMVILAARPEAAAIVAVDQQSGRERWKTTIRETVDAQSTPLIVSTDRGAELVYHHSKGNQGGLVAAMDPSNGSPRWTCAGIDDYLCPSPFVADGRLILVTSGRTLAVRPGGNGDVTNSHLDWNVNVGDEVSTPVYHDGHLYLFKSNGGGIAASISVADGKIVHRERMEPKPGRIYASPVIAGNRIYLVSQENGTYVMEATPECLLIAHNTIEDDDSIFSGTPAIVGRRIFLRSNRRLYCVGH